MKKFMFIAAAACVTLASCVKNEPAASVDQGGAEIAFEAPVLAPSVKAGVAEVPATYDDELTFGVYALYASASGWEDCFTETDGVYVPDNSYMDNVEISKNGDVWKNSSKSYYWPKSGFLSFVAYSPYKTSGVSVDEGGVKFTDYVVSTTVANQEDLLYTSICTEVETEGEHYVAVQFEHALSAINFIVKKDANTTAPIALNSIEIRNLYDKADFSAGLHPYDEDDATYVTGPNWSDYEHTGKYAARYLVYSPGQGTPYALSSEGKYTHNLGGNDDNDEASLMLLPQDIEEAYIEVHYTLDGLPQFKMLYFGKDAKWEPGKKYTYTLTFTAEEIIFEPSASEWSDVAAAFGN